MKKNRLIIIFVFVFIIFCVCVGWFISSNNKLVNSKNDSFIITCDSDTINVDKEVVCSLKGNVSDYEVSAVSAMIKESNDYKITEVIPHSSWEGDGENGDIDLFTDVNKKDKFDIVEFKIRLINKDVKFVEISIINNALFDEKFVEHKLSNFSKKLKVNK